MRVGSRLCVAAVAAVVAVVAVVLAGGPAGAQTPPSAWYQSGQNQSRSGFNAAESTLSTGNVARLHRVWQDATAEPCCGTFLGQVVAANGVAYFTSDDSALSAVNLGTGALRWHTSLSECGSSGAPPSIHLGVLVVPTTECSPDDYLSDLAGYDAATGRHLWTWTSVNSMSAPVTVDGLAFVLSQNDDGAQRIDAIDVRTGAVRWEVLPTTFISQLAADGTHLYLSGLHTEQALSPATGHVLWTRSVPGGDVLVSAGHVVFAGSSGGTTVITSFSTSGARQWQARRAGSQSYTIAATTTEVLLAGDSTVQALTLAGGAARWSHTVTGSIDGQPAIAGGVVYVPALTRSGATVSALREGTGTGLWSHAYASTATSFIDTASVSVAAGTLFVGLDGTGVIALRP